MAFYHAVYYETRTMQDVIRVDPTSVLWQEELTIYTLQKKKRKTISKKRNAKPHLKKETQNHILVTLGR